MGLTGGVKSHRLSGQISPYCEKKRHWLCAYCAPMFLFAVVRHRSGGQTALSQVTSHTRRGLFFLVTYQISITVWKDFS